MTRRRFVVHEHRARRAGLHYDLRLEMGGVLKDWAFRKAPPEENGVKRFGVAQPDHELMWLDFEGEIPKGYGAGTMRIWDKGLYEIIEETSKSMKLRFYGNRMRGDYMLLRYKNGWLLFKSSPNKGLSGRIFT